MKCGNCDKTDGLCYTSIPPQVKCTVSGKFHFYDDECNIKSIKFDELISEGHLSVACIVCGESVPLSAHEEMSMMHGQSVGSKVCDECKKAILHIRDQLSNAGRATMD